MNELKTRNVKFNKDNKKEILEKQLTEIIEKEEMKKEEMKKEEKKTEQKKNKVKRNERLQNVASLVPALDYDDTRNIIIKKMSNNSVAVKKDKKRLFRLDILKDTYQLTADRNDTIALDERVESVYNKSKDKYFYRYRTKDLKECQDIMKECMNKA